MFDFGKKKRVEAILSRRINGICIEELRGKSRSLERTACTMTTGLVPGDGQTWFYEHGFRALALDMSARGLSVIHGEHLGGDYLVEIPGINGSDFLRCSVQHSSEIGPGYFQVGLRAHEIFHPDAYERTKLAHALAEQDEKSRQEV